MKWSFVIQKKMEAALLLTTIMLVIILGTMISRHNIAGIGKSVSSIYQDRLLPATTIVYITENLYDKRLAMEKALMSEDQLLLDDARVRLDVNNMKTDSLIKSFEKTFLVEQEAKSLLALKRNLDSYIRAERSIIALCSEDKRNEARVIFEKANLEVFPETIRNLNDLTMLQSSVGKELIKDSKSDMASVDNILLFQITMAVIIGLVVLVFIQSARIINQASSEGKARKDTHFNLN